MAGRPAVNRYDRQITVPGFGAEAQRALSAARITVIGAGGLAAPALQYLAGAGIGALRIVDPDRVERHNLHRQTLFSESDCDQPKARTAARKLAALNSGIRIEARTEALHPGTVESLCADATLVLDCADSFAVSYILSDFCLARGLPLISASVSRDAGYAGGFCAGAPSLRAVFPDLPERAGSCAEEGVLGPVAGMIGALQAQMAVAVLTGYGETPLGRLVTLDAGGLRMGGFRFHGAPEPAQSFAFLDPQALDPADFLVDLRAADEAPLAHPAARRLTADDFAPEGAAELPAPGQRAVMICRTGLRSWRAARRLSTRWPGEIALVAMGDELTSRGGDI